MRSLHLLLLPLLCCGAAALSWLASADEPTPVREIFVPFADLDLLLAGQAERVFVSREEYRDLLAKAKPEQPRTAPPRKAVLLSADYSVEMAGERAFVRGTLELELLEPGLHAVSLELERVGLLAASLDDAAATLARSDDGQLLLFVEGEGRHSLRLEATTRIEASAAQQQVSFRVPTPAATQLRLTVPGNVEMRTPVLSRAYDPAAEETRFELPVVRGEQTLAMSLNNRTTASQQVVEASSVVVDEVTLSAERLHAVLTMRVLRGAVDLFRFRLPAGLEVTEVSAPEVARWGVLEAADGGPSMLDVQLHEPTTDTISFAVTASAARPMLGSWTMPRIEPLGVTSHTAVLGLLLDERLKAESFEAEKLISIDTAVFEQILPESVAQPEPGGSVPRAVAAWLAADSTATARSEFTRPASGVDATTATLLTLQDAELRLRSTISLSPRVDPLFAVELQLPAGWEVTAVTDAQDQSLAFAPLIGAEDDTGGIHVGLPQPVAAGGAVRLTLEATHVPDGWLDAWTELPVRFPAVGVAGADGGEGAIAITATDDLAVRPERIEGLIPLARRELEALGLSADEGTFAYRLEGPLLAASFLASRKTPELTARSLSFFRIGNEAVATHAELLYDIERASATSLSFSLPDTTPKAISLRGLGKVQVTEFSSREAEGRRIWTARLADRTRGQAGLAIDFEEPLTVDGTAELVLPCAAAEAVGYQTAAVAVEGNPELSVALATAGRPIDVGELVDAEAEVGRRLLGVYGFAGTASVTATLQRRPGYGLPTAITQRAALVTLQGAGGTSQTAARFLLRTNASFLQVTLPSAATLWSVTINGLPSLPQRDGDDLLVSLPGQPGGDVLRDVSIVYQRPSARLDWMGEVSEEAPQLAVRSEDGLTRFDVPLADVEWQMVLPDGYRVVRSEGSVFAAAEAARPWSLVTPAKLLAQLGGGIEGVGWHSPLLKPLLPQAQSPLLLAGRRSVVATDAPARGLGTENALALLAAPELPAAVDKAEMAVDEVMAEEKSKDQPPVEAPLSEPAAPPDADFVPATPIPEGSPETFAWALAGVRSLPIELADQGRRVSFASLGGQPRLSAMLVQESRLFFATVGIAVLVAACGLAVAGGSWRARRWVVVCSVVLTLAAPIAIELTAGLQLHDLFQPGFLVAVVLLPCYAVIDAVRWVAHRLPRRATPRAVGVVVGLLLVAAAIAVVGEEPAEPAAALTIADILEMLDPRHPLAVPDDAVIIPYDPDGAGDDAGQAGGLPSAARLAAAGKVLIPYEHYTRLKAIAEGDDASPAVVPPASFALAGGAYTSRLDDRGELVVRGRLELEVFAKGPVDLPLRLTGGVLERASLDGQAAVLRLVEPATPATGEQEPQQQAAMPPAVDPLVVLAVEGIGRHTLDLVIRMPLQQRGGWRSVRGQLPAAPATQLALTVPNAQTELRIVGADGLITQQTQRADEQLQTALAADASIAVEWRSEVSAARVDEALTARSLAVIDVREDGVHATWQVDLDVRQGQRDVFTLEVPDGWLVEAVQGPKVRGWEIVRRQEGDAAAPQQIDVTLLEPASGDEQLWVRLSRPVDVLFGEQVALRLPAVVVPEAVLHQGFVVLRRGPLVDLRVAQAAGLVRDDPPADRLAAVVDRFPDESPLAVQAFQAYRFANDRFELEVAPRPRASQLAVDVQTLLRIAQRQSTFETRLACVIDDRPTHRLQVELPAGVTVEQVSCRGLSGWTVVPGSVPRLVIDLTAGATGAWSATITGTLDGGMRVAAPAFVVVDARRQTTTLVVQADPSVSVEVAGLENAETIPLPQTFTWLAAEQRTLARLAVFARGPGFQADFQAIRRQPVVKAVGLTNVQVTPRELAETVLLRFDIAEAGIRELSFLLPETLQDALVHVPLLLEKTVEPVAEQPGLVRFHLQLQDDVIGPLAVLVEHTGPLVDQTHAAAVPQIETGTTEHRFVVLENQGRDEIVVTESEGVRELSRQQAAWRELASILPGTATQAYLVAADAVAPRLGIGLRSRSLVESAGARIGLAVTTLSVDGGGVYRATQEYRIDNKTEQLLEVQLPDGATLWSAVVAGEPVKPTAVDDDNGRRVGIPLIKTQAGDLDYAVVLTYGGTLGPLGTKASVRFPFLETININVEQSQVRLWLPETHRWFGFDGTLRQTDDADELAADFLAYQNKKLQQLMQVASSESQDVFSRVRARTNALQLGESLQGYVDSYSGSGRASGGNDRLQRELMTNSAIVEESQAQAGQMPAEAMEAAAGNGSQLRAYFDGQQVARGTNVVKELNLNFEAPGPVEDRAAETSSLNRVWVDSNRFGRSAGDGLADGERAAAVRKLGKQVADPAAAAAERPGFDVNFEDIEKKRSLGRGGEQAGEASTREPQQQAVELRDQVQRYQLRLERDGLEGQQQRQFEQSSANATASGFLGDRRLAEEAEESLLRQSRRGGLPEGRSDGFAGGMGGAGGLGGMGGGLGGGTSWFGSGVDDTAAAALGVAAAQSPATGLASLEVAIPTRGREVLFTTPRGDLVITAEAVDARLVDRGTRLAVVLAAVVGCWVLATFGGLAWRRLGPRAGGLLLILLGLASMLTLTLPLVGMATAVFGCGAVARSVRWRRVATA